MDAFQAILQKYHGQSELFTLTKMNHFDFLNHVYKNNCHLKTKSAHFLYYYLMRPFSKNEASFTNQKFNELNNFLNNIFTPCWLREELLNEFSKIQKIYNGFARFAHIYKFKRAKVQVDSDLCMNQLNPKKSNVFTLYQNGAKYYFSMNDLINILNRNLSNCLDFSPQPIVTKNPFNNIILKDVDLYNIYFFIKWSGYVTPELFHGFFLSNLNIRTFRFNYEFNIVNNHIKNYIYNSHHDTLYPIFKEMWKHYDSITRKMIISYEFPKDILINIMKPYLHLYYLSLYSTNGTYKQCNAGYLLRQKLIRFKSFNPKFGRKYIHYKTDFFGKRKRTEEYDTNHINFYKDPVLQDAPSRSGINENEVYRDFITSIRTELAFHVFQNYGRQQVTVYENADREPTPRLQNDSEYESEDDSERDFLHNPEQQHQSSNQINNSDGSENSETDSIS
jgi:hypothetical protein